MYGLVVLVGTAVFGTVLSLSLGARLAEVDWPALVPAGRGGAVLEIVLGAGLLVWAAVRLTRTTVRAPKPRRVRAGSWGLLGTGALFALSAVLDPTFVALTVLAGRGQDIGAVLAAQVLWVLISQAPLVLLLAVMARGGHERAVRRFTSWWERARPVVKTVITVALVLIGVVLVVDGLWWFVTGAFLLPAPS
ncbi:MAG TPA: hypothetical protein VEX66_16445 [Microlunatus sp.]|nr:hypothetical protein [Microlunatus sp.]